MYMTYKVDEIIAGISVLSNYLKTTWNARFHVVFKFYQFYSTVS